MEKEARRDISDKIEEEVIQVAKGTDKVVQDPEAQILCTEMVRCRNVQFVNSFVTGRRIVWMVINQKE